MGTLGHPGEVWVFRALSVIASLLLEEKLTDAASGCDGVRAVACLEHPAVSIAITFSRLFLSESPSLPSSSEPVSSPSLTNSGFLPAHKHCDIFAEDWDSDCCSSLLLLPYK